MNSNHDFSQRVVLRSEEMPWLASPAFGVQRKMFDRVGAEQGRATTSWWLAPLFKRHYPQIELEATAIYVEADTLATTGATNAMFTAVLRYIEKTCGPVLSQNTAKFLLIDPDRQSQAAFISESLLMRPRSPFSERAERYLRQHLSDSALSIETLSQHCNMSARTLARHFQKAFHKSPQHYLQQLRIDAAKALLETSAMSLDEIVIRVGYSDLASFRKLFKRSTDLTPNQYRTRFSLRGPN